MYSSILRPASAQLPLAAVLRQQNTLPKDRPCQMVCVLKNTSDLRRRKKYRTYFITMGRFWWKDFLR